MELYTLGIRVDLPAVLSMSLLVTLLLVQMPGSQCWKARPNAGEMPIPFRKPTPPWAETGPPIAFPFPGAIPIIPNAYPRTLGESLVV